MGYEVELKVFVDRQEVGEPELKKQIDSFTHKNGAFIKKEDIYYHVPSSPEPSFRIRDEENRLLITMKEKHKENGVECNKELEFSHENVADKAVLQEMARHLGYEVLRIKRKTGWEWTYEDVHIELLNVSHLGWYLEMEAISKENASSMTEPLKKELFELLDTFGFTPDQIETRGYHRMLRELEAKEGIICN